MSWADLLSRGRQDSFLYEGVISQDAANVNDRVLVTVLAHDRQQTFGPAPFHPRVDDDGAVVLPQEGDSCVVGFAATDDPGTPTIWILSYEP